MDYTPLAIVVQTTAILAVGACTWLAFVSIRHSAAPGAKELVALFIALSIWSTGVFLEYALPAPEHRLTASKFAYFGVVSAPVFALGFVLHYTHIYPDMYKLRRRVWLLLLWFIPAVSLYLVLVFPRTQLLWTSYDVHGQNVLVIEYGPWMIVHVGYFWLVTLVSGLLLSWYAFSLRAAYRRRALLIGFAIILPVIPSVVYVARLSPQPTADFTHVGILASAVLLMLASRDYQLLELMPLPTGQLLDAIPDAIVVVNTQQRILDLNSRALAEMNLTQPPLGKPWEEVMQAWLQSRGAEGECTNFIDELRHYCAQPQESLSGDILIIKPQRRTIHWRVSALEPHTRSHRNSWILAWRDVTEERRRLATLYEQDKAIALLHQRKARQLGQETRTLEVLEQIDIVGRQTLDALEHADIATASALTSQLLAVMNALPHNSLDKGDTTRQVPPSDSPTFLAGLDAYLREYAKLQGSDYDFICNNPDIEDLLQPWALVQFVRILQEILDTVRHGYHIHAIHVALTAEPTDVKFVMHIRNTPTNVGNSAAHRPGNMGTTAINQGDIQGSSTLDRRVADVDGNLTIQADGNDDLVVTLTLPTATDDHERQTHSLAQELLSDSDENEESEARRRSLALGLTDRQADVLALVVRGFTYVEVAAQLYVSERTVRSETKAIRERMGVQNRREMIDYAVRHELVSGGVD